MRSEIILTEIDILKKDHAKAMVEKNSQKARQVMKKIEHKVREYNIVKGEETLQAAEENGVVEKFNRLVAAAQILNSVCHNITQEATELLQNNGLFTEGIAVESKTYNRAADRYFNEFRKLVKTDECSMSMFKDIDWFENWFRIWTRLKERPKEQRLRGCLKAAHKADGLRTCKKCNMIPNIDSIICRACGRAFVEGSQKGAKWLDNKLHPKEEKKEEENK